MEKSCEEFVQDNIQKMIKGLRKTGLFKEQDIQDYIPIRQGQLVRDYYLQKLQELENPHARPTSVPQ